MFTGSYRAVGTYYQLTLLCEACTGTGGELWHAPSRRGKNASPAADRWHTFTFPAHGDAVAVWGASAAFLSPSLIAPPRGRAVVTTGAHGPRIALPCRPAGPAAPAPAPQECAAGNRVERGFRGEFRPRVRVVASHHRQFEPRDGCRRESAATRRASTGRERKPISGVQRRRRPVRQACMAINAPRCANHMRWELGVNNDQRRSFFAFLKTPAIIAAVSFPVLVF